MIDETISFDGSDTGEGYEHLDRVSQTSCFLPSLQVSVSSNEGTLATEQRLEANEASLSFQPHHESLISQGRLGSLESFTAHIKRDPKIPHVDTLNPNGNVECRTAVSNTQWRPKYLRRRIIAAFSVIFLLIIASLEALSVISDQKDGIAKGFNKDHYLWTYGPTAFLTLIAAFFNRVEFQAKLMAPWARLSKQPAPARKNLLLDYISPLQPVAICKSLRNKDFAVSALTTVSVILKLLIVLSSGLITLSRTAVHYERLPMEIQNTFIDDGSLLRAGNSVMYIILQGLVGGMDYPPGISDKFAFQSVQSQLPDTAQYQVIVNGLTVSLECEIAQLNMTCAKSRDPRYYPSTMTFAISSPSCDATLIDTDGPYPKNFGKPLAFGIFKALQCDETKDDAGKRVLLMFGLEQWYSNGETLPVKSPELYCSSSADEPRSTVRAILLQSTQLLCAPKYEISKVIIIQNGTKVQSVTPTPPSPGDLQEVSNRTLEHVSPWSFMEVYLNALDSFSVSKGVDLGLDFGQTHLLLDKYMSSLVGSQVPNPNDTDFSQLYNPSFIQSIATTYHQQVGAIIARNLLMKPASINTTGSAVIWEDRLVVRDWAVQWMAALIAICLALLIFTAFNIPQYRILDRSPSTLAGIAALIANSTDLLERLRYSGDAISKTLRLQLEGSKFQSEVIQHTALGLAQLQQSIIIKDLTLASTSKAPWSFHQTRSIHSHPWILHPASRLSLGLILVALIVTIEVTLQQSNRQDGLGNVGDNAYIHYTWTSIPALVFGGLAVLLSSMDFSIRSLAPYISLSNAITTDTFRTLDFLDMSVPSAIVKEAKMGSIGALATTATLLVASFFTIFSGSLFQGVSLSSTTLVLLRANASFGRPGSQYNGVPNSYGVNINAPLILLSNLSYPTFTYEDLAFPEFLPTTAFAAKMPNTSLLSTKAVLPALRSHLDCRSYDKSVIRVEFDHEPRLYPLSSSDERVLTITVNSEVCFNSYSFDHNMSFNAQFSISTNTSYFGVSTTPTLNWPPGTFRGGCSKYLFMWGKVSPLAGPNIEHIAAVGCNQSIEAVDVETSFIGADLAIDMETPPRPVPNTERNVTSSLGQGFDVYTLYSEAPTVPADEALDNTFALLTQSRWAIPLPMLGGGNDEAVAAALKFQHGILFAQALNEVRVPATETNSTLTPEQALEGENDAGRTFEATVVDKAGRQRVVQDAISTRVLEALLLVTLILLGVGWVWLPKTNVLPKRSPTTIASAVALLAGGNLEEWVHELDSDTTGEREGPGKTKKFWMGWGNVPDEEGILMGNENENGISRFGIFAIPVDRSDEK